MVEKFFLVFLSFVLTYSIFQHADNFSLSDLADFIIITFICIMLWIRIQAKEIVKIIKKQQEKK